MQYMIEVHFPEVPPTMDEPTRLSLARIIERMDVDKADFVPSIGDEVEIDAADRGYHVWGMVTGRLVGYVNRSKFMERALMFRGNPNMVTVTVQVRAGRYRTHEIKDGRWVEPNHDGLLNARRGDR